MDKRDKHYDILNTHSPNTSQVTKHVSIVTGASVIGQCLILISEAEVGN